MGLALAAVRSGATRLPDFMKEMETSAALLRGPDGTRTENGSRTGIACSFLRGIEPVRVTHTAGVHHALMT